MFKNKSINRGRLPHAAAMLLVPGEEGSGDWTHSLWQRGRSAVLQMARVPYLLAGRCLGVGACVSLMFLASCGCVVVRWFWGV